MNYKLLSVSKNVPAVNIGDYVQALASSQFYPHVDGFVERDELSLYDGDECGVIMNGWYMANPENWPPSEKIKPLFVAFHVNSKAKAAMMSPQSIAYLKRYEPIGCRDTYTRDMLIKNNINAYFSGCMTLTLGLKYHSEKKDNKVYFVDPFFITHWNFWSIIKGVVYLATHFRPIAKIAKKHPEHKSFLRKCMILTGFYREYSKFFSKKLLVDAEYICQQDTSYNKNFITNEELLNEAEHLVKKYARAGLVVTSRIHCALPCLGLNTPVIFIEDANQSEASACRFGGLKELFNAMEWKNGNLIPNFDVKKIVTLENYPKNKPDWHSYCEILNRRCKEFIEGEKKQL